MDQISPVGPVYQAGTLAGNPLAMACGLATLEELSAAGTYEDLDAAGALLAAGLSAAAKKAAVAATVTRVGSMLCTFFGAGAVRDYESATASDTEKFGRFFLGMLERGIYLAPSQFEAMFVSTGHGPAELEATIAAAAEVFRTL